MTDAQLQAYHVGAQIAMRNMGLSKQASTRTEEMLFGPLHAGLDKNPENTFGKSYLRNAMTGGGMMMGTIPGIAAALAGHPKTGLGLGLAGLVGGGIGGRLLGENMTDYDPKRGW